MTLERSMSQRIRSAPDEYGDDLKRIERRTEHVTQSAYQRGKRHGLIIGVCSMSVAYIIYATIFAVFI